MKQFIRKAFAPLGKLNGDGRGYQGDSKNIYNIMVVCYPTLLTNSLLHHMQITANPLCFICRRQVWMILYVQTLFWLVGALRHLVTCSNWGHITLSWMHSWGIARLFILKKGTGIRHYHCLILAMMVIQTAEFTRIWKIEEITSPFQHIVSVSAEQSGVAVVMFWSLQVVTKYEYSLTFDNFSRKVASLNL